MWLHPSSCNLTLLLDSWQFLIPDEKGKEKAKTNARLKTKTKTRRLEIVDKKSLYTISTN